MKSIKTILTILMIVAMIPVFAQSKTNSNAVTNNPANGTQVNDNGRSIDTATLTPDQKAQLLKKKQESKKQVNNRTVVTKKGTKKKVVKKVTPAPVADSTKNVKGGLTVMPKRNGENIAPSGNKSGFKATPVKNKKSAADTLNKKAPTQQVKKIKVVKVTDTTNTVVKKNNAKKTAVKK
jgi:hypothetical protein